MRMFPPSSSWLQPTSKSSTKWSLSLLFHTSRLFPHSPENSFLFDVPLFDFWRISRNKSTKLYQFGGISICDLARSCALGAFSFSRITNLHYLLLPILIMIKSEDIPYRSHRRDSAPNYLPYQLAFRQSVMLWYLDPPRFEIADNPILGSSNTSIRLSISISPPTM